MALVEVYKSCCDSPHLPLPVRIRLPSQIKMKNINQSNPSDNIKGAKIFRMATYKIKMTLPTQWVITTEASSEEEAIQKALKADPPSQLAYQDDDEWQPDIMEWPFVAGMTIDAYED